MQLQKQQQYQLPLNHTHTRAETDTLITGRTVLLLRGHVRQSMETDRLIKFIGVLTKCMPELDIYIQTWDMMETTMGWRKYNPEYYCKILTKSDIEKYFESVIKHIKGINIISDESVNIPGNINGSILVKGNVSILGWKRMLWGITAGLESIYLQYSSDTYVINMRLDYFDAHQTYYNGISQMGLVSHILNNVKSVSTIDIRNQIEFYYDRPFTGVDNYCIGTVANLYQFFNYILHELDTIKIDYINTVHQEHIIYKEARRNNWKNYIATPILNVTSHSTSTVMNATWDYIVVGAGLSGSVMAERLAAGCGARVLVLEKREHLAGNCYDYMDEKSGCLVNEYGAHIFHTNDIEVWDYVNRFAKWVRYEHKVAAMVDGRVVPVPVNPETVNVLMDEKLQTESDMARWLAENTEQCSDPKTSRDVCLARVGPVLYEIIFRSYTFKQWGKYPEELGPEVCARIPVRTNNDTRYFTDKYQALPVGGYTELVRNILNHPLITIRLSTDYFEFIKSFPELGNVPVIYTGPIDTYYNQTATDCNKLPPLEYRSLRFEKEHIPVSGFYQTHSVVNYPESSVPFTRIVEYKHFPNTPTKSQSDDSKITVIVKEYSSPTGEPYYPVPTPENQRLYEKYRRLTASSPNVHFIGRLANYKYFNMDQAIKNSLDYYAKVFAAV